MPAKRNQQHKQSSEGDDSQAADSREAITPKQQEFIAALLSGKCIRDAALFAGVSRRAATYWMADHHHVVRREYERQRIASQDALQSKVAKVHDLAFTALEDLLGKKTPAAYRLQAMKMVYEAHLQAVCEPKPLQSAPELIVSDAIQSFENDRKEGSAQVYLYDDHNRERITDD